MIYTVGEMAQKLGVPASTLRYYDKEGLLPFVERSSGGIRMFRENDFEWLQVIRCMKQAGMSIKDIRQYIELAMQGDDTIDTRLEMFQHQREVLTQQIQQLQHTLETVEYKCWFYETAKAAGTVDAPGAMTDADVPERFRAIRQELRSSRFLFRRLRCEHFQFPVSNLRFRFQFPGSVFHPWAPRICCHKTGEERRHPLCRHSIKEECKTKWRSKRGF